MSSRKFYGKYCHYWNGKVSTKKQAITRIEPTTSRSRGYPGRTLFNGMLEWGCKLSSKMATLIVVNALGSLLNYLREWNSSRYYPFYCVCAVKNFGMVNREGCHCWNRNRNLSDMRQQTILVYLIHAYPQMGLLVQSLDGYSDGCTCS